MIALIIGDLNWATSVLLMVIILSAIYVHESDMDRNMEGEDETKK